ncbi:MAG: hypothetical protein V4727_03770 [Verrucomicrobiota bacterium]
MTDKERQESANLILSFLDETCGAYDWDDFISPSSKDPDFELLRVYCASTNYLYPPTDPKCWCSDLGSEKLRILSELLISTSQFKVISDFICSEQQKYLK